MNQLKKKKKKTTPETKREKKSCEFKRVFALNMHNVALECCWSTRFDWSKEIKK